jgi:hypothetical protein
MKGGDKIASKHNYGQLRLKVFCLNLTASLLGLVIVTLCILYFLGIVAARDDDDDFFKDEADGQP